MTDFRPSPLRIGTIELPNPVVLAPMFAARPIPRPSPASPMEGSQSFLSTLQSHQTTPRTMRATRLFVSLWRCNSERLKRQSGLL